MTNAIIVLVTCKDRKQAQAIAQGLLEKKLIACANLIGRVESRFWWEGKIDHGKETMLVLKTQKNVLSRIITVVKTLHSYETPEIIALPIIGGSKDYLKWIKESVC